jgi:hypothetical protein
MKYESNYYVNGFGFEDYDEAKRYADFLLNWKRIYKCVFTRAEMNTMHQEDAESLNDFREHFNEVEG